MTQIDDMPGHLVRRFQQIAVAVFHAEVADAGFDLTPVQYAALVSVNAHPDIDQVTLAGLIAYDRTTIAGVVDRLVQKGFLTREVSDRDRRARVLRVTDAGLETIGNITPAVEEAQKVMLGGLTDEEARAFLRLLRKATDAANDLSRAPLRTSSTDATADGRIRAK
ncbi:MarR family winged helix-turn-helix transcriptional regulator [Mesorhizobium xinjiangense]|uniref:MarR family winged helix-turn-helix transcriptional regulator n=1 Tax=Mesorhizobium xinjiangense TaxID=2678685 RepID=UPI0012ED51C0|nr:MarR family winged helix-turn-helix transcriptional regulator [Mesorhizobium xinjiangense]